MLWIRLLTMMSRRCMTMMLKLSDYEVTILRLALLSAKINAQRITGSDEPTQFDELIRKVDQASIDDYINKLLRRADRH